ncbi:MAG: hypothetical protein QUU85_17060, partial [Candidatus Eisenbacteria bacterium]|nr:hypothetical protein [Candidatus Eisenbacteria bacterium]
MRHVEDRHVGLLSHPEQVGKDPRAERKIERGERLIEQQSRRITGERAGEGDALPLPAAQLGRAPLQQPACLLYTSDA